jgi:hypothetical protein
MIRHIRHAALLGAVLMGAGCQQSTAPAESDFVPRPQFIPADQAQITTRVSGVAWDPEAFFFNLAMCGPDCPIPPFLSEGVPHYLRSAVRGANVLTFDVEGSPPPGPIGQPAVAGGDGIWVLPNMPARYGTPYFTFNTGVGALATEPIGPPFPGAPPTEYLPTLTLRPIFTGGNGTCVSQESVHVGKNGILEAVARHMTATGTATTVDDLVNPAKYWGTNVFWFYIAGNPVLRAPADGIALELDIDGAPPQKFAVDWAPPGVLPPFLNQSTRGFYVTNASVSPLGVYVVLLPNAGPPPSKVRYLIKDTKTNAQSLRPWNFAPITGGIGPGIVTFAGIQMQFPKNPQNPGYPPPPFICLPPM